MRLKNFFCFSRRKHPLLCHSREGGNPFRIDSRLRGNDREKGNDKENGNDRKNENNRGSEKNKENGNDKFLEDDRFRGSNRFLTQENLFFSILLMSIFILSWWLQSHVLTGWDASCGLNEAKKMFEGGVDGKAFFESCPPLFLYLFYPSIVIAKNFSLNLLFSLKLYLYFLSIMSLILCYPYVKKIFTDNKTLAAFFFLMIASLFVLLPLPNEFGQREHFLMLLTMPYFLLMSCRLQHIPVSKISAIIIGIFAALGFLIKPFFLITPFLIELYYLFNQRRLFAFMRIEVGILLGLILLYGLTLGIFFQSYFQLVLPIALRFYYASYHLSWLTLLFHPLIIFSLIIVLFNLFLYPSISYKKLNGILLVALIGFYIVYFVQQTNWYYHLYPAFSISMLLLILLFIPLVTKKNIAIKEYIGMSLFGLSIYVLFCYYFATVVNVIVVSKILFFSFFAVFFGILIYILQKKKSLLNLSSSILIIISIGWLFSYFLQKDNWYPYLFSVTLFLLILLFGLFSNKKLHTFFIVFLGTLFFSFPVYFFNLSYSAALFRKEKLLPLIDFLHTHARHREVYFFSTMLIAKFPTIDYAGVTSNAKYSAFFWLPSLLKQTPEKYFPYDKNFFIDNIAYELNIYRPKLVLVDIQKNKAYLDSFRFDYLAFFLKNPKFVNVWRHYHYLTTIEGNPFYQFNVYQRD